MQGSNLSTYLLSESRDQSPEEHHFTYKNFLYDKMNDEEQKATDAIAFDIVLFSRSSLETPWKEYCCETSSLDNIRISIKSSFFPNVTNYIRGLQIEDTQLLSRTDKALESISKRVRTLSEGFFFNIRSIPPSRTPGFAIDGWIIIPEYDRNLEHKIYRELGDIIRKNPNMLFNIRILARKGRELNDVIPKGYRKYNPWLEYIC